MTYWQAWIAIGILTFIASGATSAWPALMAAGGLLMVIAGAAGIAWDLIRRRR